MNLKTLKKGATQESQIIYQTKLMHTVFLFNKIATFRSIVLHQAPLN